jgi:cyclophilin family peptidyl-prolyl cis-trans isomerase/protein-disulfide isomerase
MHRSIAITVLVFALLLSACAPAATPVATEAAIEPEATATVTQQPTFTATSMPTATPEPTITIPQSDPATCQASPIIPVLSENAKSYLPDVTSSDWSKGSNTAILTIIEYGDFQDENSKKLASVLDQLIEKYPDDVRVIFRHFPLPEQYDKDQLAAQAAEAAGLQGKFWQYHNLLFLYQSDWIELSTDEFTDWAYEKAAELGLDAEQFKQDMVSSAIVSRVDDSRLTAVKMNKIYSNFYDPFLFFNGAAISMLYNLDTLSSVVELYKLPQRSISECPPFTVDTTKTYTATLHTEKGDIVIELFADKAPWAVNSFVYLAQSGWYEGTAFYRVTPGYLAQAGDPSNSGLGSPGYSFSNELTPDLHFNKAGVVAMANAGADTNGSQFFITYTAVPSLDGKYTIFGQVTEGMDVLNMLRPRDPYGDAILLPPDPITSISIEIN